MKGINSGIRHDLLKICQQSKSQSSITLEQQIWLYVVLDWFKQTWINVGVLYGRKWYTIILPIFGGCIKMKKNDWQGKILERVGIKKVLQTVYRRMVHFLHLSFFKGIFFLRYNKNNQPTVHYSHFIILLY